MRAGRRASHSGRSYPRSGREESGHTLDSPTVRYQTVDDGSPATSLGSSLYSSCSSAATEYEANPQFNDPEFDSDAEDAKDKFLYRYCYQCPFAVDRKDAWIPYDRQLWRCLVFHNCQRCVISLMHGERGKGDVVVIHTNMRWNWMMDRDIRHVLGLPPRMHD